MLGLGLGLRKRIFVGISNVLSFWKWGDNGAGKWGDNGAGKWGDNL